MLLTTVTAYGWIRRSRRRASGFRAGLILATTIVLLTLGLDVSFFERHEHLEFLRAWPWISMISIALFAILDGYNGAFEANPGVRRRAILRYIRSLPERPIWNFLIAWVLMLSASHLQTEYQTLDDDEYASVQAVLAIARTGAPEFEVEGVSTTPGARSTTTWLPPSS